MFSDWGLTLALAATFFFASAGASAAYLTVSEIFPMEIRALAIAFFYAIGTAIGGITGPLVFEKLGESGDVGQVMIAYFIGAAVMAVGGIVELFLGVRAEQKPLENIAKPITAEEAEEGTERGRRRAPRGRGARPAKARALGARADGPAALPARARNGSYSPFLPPPYEPNPDWLDHEISIIDRALQEHGELDRRELAERIGARFWGPGRFTAALRGAVSDGVGAPGLRDRYAERPPRPRGRSEMPLGCAVFGHRCPLLDRGRDDALVLRARVRVRGLEGVLERRRGGPLRRRLRPRGRATTSAAAPRSRCSRCASCAAAGRTR